MAISGIFNLLRKPKGALPEAEATVRMRARMIYEVVRQEGVAEMRRPAQSLWWSGVAAGAALFISVIAQGVMETALPDAPWSALISSFGYTFGFLIVVLGRLTLFTEHTVTAVLPVLTDPGPEQFRGLARLWGIVFLANLVGALAMALLTAHGGIHPAEHLEGFLEVSRKFAAKTPGDAFLHAIPAGFLIAAMVWMMPANEGASFWIVLATTYLIALGGYAHVIAGSGEAFLLLLVGEIGAVKAAAMILPALAGNTVGGAALFAALAYGQVRREIKQENGEGEPAADPKGPAARAAPAPAVTSGPTPRGHPPS